MSCSNSTETAWIHVGLTVVTLGAAVAAIVPAAEGWFSAGVGCLLGLGALRIVIRLVRRELRIRRRLAAIRDEPVPTPISIGKAA